MVHAASVLTHHLSGTIYHDISETMTLVVNNSLAIWRQFCLHGPIRQRRLWERLLKRRFINGLTYLLTLTTPQLAPAFAVHASKLYPISWLICNTTTAQHHDTAAQLIWITIQFTVHTLPVNTHTHTSQFNNHFPDESGLAGCIVIMGGVSPFHPVDICLEEGRPSELFCIVYSNNA